ncbi:MAG: M56 family metallopeptidase [Planctomycetota bacterium]|nr:M56 family metallopeptidase [Planctomycetota bacterium]
MNTNGLVGQWAQWMLHAGWQAAVVAMAALIVLWLMGRRISAQLRFAVLCVALLKFAMPPFLIGSGALLETTSMFSSGDWISVPSFSTEVSHGGVVSARSSNAPPDQDSTTFASGTLPMAASVARESANTSHRQAPDFAVTATDSTSRWLLLLAIVYVCGVIVALLAVARQFARVRKVVHQARSASMETQERATVLCKRLKMKLPGVLVSDNGDSPFATGVLRPVVVLPRNMIDSLETDQLDIVLAHELVHIRRRDLVTGWMEVMLTVIWWFHPVIWLLRLSLQRTREECCDDALVAGRLAQPVRYCETLIQVARCQAFSFSEPIVLGFASGEHPAANRIRRLMDSKLLRRDRLRIPAIVVTLLLALFLLPGMKAEESPVSRTTLEGLFGWTNLPFKISEEEEARVTELREIAQTYFNTRNDVRQFDEPDTRNRLDAILKEQPGYFYAQHLLGMWHVRNGDAPEGQRLIDDALKAAPVVLSRRYRFGNGDPLQHIEIQRTTIECNRVQKHSLDPGLKLMYPALVTDNEGRIRIPVYDTVFRASEYSWPDGYHLEETETLGWFKSKTHTGVLPDMLVWVPYSRPQDFTRRAAETKLLKDAAGTRNQEITSGGNTYVLESVARANQDATFVLEDGRGAAVTNALRPLPDVKNAAWMDHAVIDLKVPDPEQFDIQKTVVLDSRTKLPLQGFQSGAGVRAFDNQRFHLYSLWKTLPESIDLVLQVYNYNDGFRLIVPACEGATVQHNGTTLTIPHLIAGQHQGWSSAAGYVGEPTNVNSTSEVSLSFTGKSEQKFSVWVVLKNGDRWNMKSGGWFSANLAGGGGERLNIPLEKIDHFELCPYTEPTTIYFEDVRLPARRGVLDENVPDVNFAVNQLEQEFTSDVCSPLNIHFRSLRGRVFSGIGSGQSGVSLHERDKKQQKPDTDCTIVWEMDGNVQFSSKAEFVIRLDAKIDPKKLGTSSSFSANSERTSVAADSRSVPLEAVQAVLLHLSSK